LRCGWPERLFWWSWKHSFYAFSVTQPARGTATPLFDVFTETHRGHRIRMAGIGLYAPNIAHFPQKSMIYGRFRVITGRFQP
jgi:hypothetical protein